MIRRLLFGLLLIGAVCVSCCSIALCGEILAEPEAARHGLTRAWYTQVQADPTMGGISDVVLDHGMVFVQTNQAILQALDAETGQTLWTQQVGNPRYPTLTPSVSNKMVAVVNGSDLMVLNRRNGKLLWKTKLEGAPGAAPALSQMRVYVPMTSGLITSYQLTPMKDPLQELGKEMRSAATPEQKTALEAERLDSIRLEQKFIPPLSCQSLGRSLVQPLITRQTADEEYIAWPTDQGYMCVAKVNRREQQAIQMVYRLQTEAPIIASPAYLPADPKVLGDSGVIYGVSQDGYVHAVRERDGFHLWRFSTGEAIQQAPVVIGQSVYVMTQLGGMFCLNAKTGAHVWWTPGVMQFLAASKDRLYTADRLGRILILDTKTGARLDTIVAGEMLPIKPTNMNNDRLFLASKTGIVQCLHESDLSDPVVHRTAPKEYQDAPKAAPKTAAEAKPDDQEKKEASKPSAAPRSSTPSTSKPKPKPKKTPKAMGSGDFGSGSGDMGPPIKGKKGKGKKISDPDMGGSMPPMGPGKGRAPAGTFGS